MQSETFDDSMLCAKHALVIGSGLCWGNVWNLDLWECICCLSTSQLVKVWTVSILKWVIQLTNYVIRTARLARRSSKSIWPTRCHI